MAQYEANRNSNKLDDMDSVLERIHSTFIKLPKDEITRNNKILKAVNNEVIELLSNHSTLFKNLYRSLYFGGSFYDGLKVHHPDEFDLNILLYLPKLMKRTLEISDHPGYKKLYLTLDEFRKSDQVHRYPGIEKKLIGKDVYGNNYLDNAKVRKWFEGLIDATLGETYKFSFYNEDEILSTVTMSKHGPAFTLNVKNSNSRWYEAVEFDVDFVPSFILENTYWTSSGKSFGGEFLLIPKPRKKGSYSHGDDWRPIFPSQEKKLIHGKQRLKQAVRLLKKLRDKRNDKFMASYYIKTIALYEQEKRYESFWNKSLSYVFMEFLKSYLRYLENEKIPYFWNEHYNLLENIKNNITISDLKYSIKNIIRRIELCYEDHQYYNLKMLEDVLKDALLTPDETVLYNNKYEQIDATGQMEELVIRSSSEDEETSYANNRVSLYRPSYVGSPRITSTRLRQPEEEGIGLAEGAVIAAGVVGVVGAVALGAMALSRFFNTPNNRRN